MQYIAILNFFIAASVKVGWQLDIVHATQENHIKKALCIP